jgi:hypothetical protein
LRKSAKKVKVPSSSLVKRAARLIALVVTVGGALGAAYLFFLWGRGETERAAAQREQIEFYNPDLWQSLEEGEQVSDDILAMAETGFGFPANLEFDSDLEIDSAKRDVAQARSRSAGGAASEIIVTRKRDMSLP